MVQNPAETEVVITAADEVTADGTDVGMIDNTPAKAVTQEEMEEEAAAIGSLIDAIMAQLKDETAAIAAELPRIEPATKEEGLSIAA